MTASSRPSAGAEKRVLPTGTITFAFTDIEGSTTRWERDRAAMQEAVRRHDEIVRKAITEHGGQIFKTIGDAFCAAFVRAENAVAAMLAAQQGLIAEDFSATDGLRVRAAIHSGTADERNADYFGPTVNKAARLLAIGHGGQVLVTNETAMLVSGALPANVSLRDIGAYHLKDFTEPQRVRQLIAPGLPTEFPPLRSLGTLPSDLSIVDVAQFHPVPGFSGRDEELASVHAALQHDGAIAVVQGLGGVGKSSVAREYGWRNRDAYSVMWWLNAQTDDGIVDGLQRLGAMFVPGLDQLADRRVAAQRVINSVLGGFDKPVLLVFDNLEDEPLMRTWLPRTARALVTSRDTAWHGDIKAISLQTWSLEIAIEYLKSASGRPDLSTADARAIAQSLGALPLALAHAAAALRTLRMVSPQRYLEHVSEHLKNAPRGAEYPRSVFATFNTAIVQAEQQAPGAAAVLCFAACFAPDAIPDDLFHEPIRGCPEGLQPIVPGDGALDLRDAVAGDLHLDEVLGTLDRLSLLAFERNSSTYSMHRLVQLAARDLVNDVAAWAEFGVEAVYAAFPRAEFATWPQCERVLPHARAALDALPRDLEPLAAAKLTRRCAIYLTARGEYGEAERLCARALTILENALGPDHPDVAIGLNNLGVLYAELGRFAEAERPLMRALRIREKALGTENRYVARSLNNLALIYTELGRYAEAEALYKRSLAIREKTDPSEVVLSLLGLGALYRTTKRYAEAESLLTSVMEMRTQTVGADHPEVAMSLIQLAELYSESDRGSEAEPLYLRALAIWEKAFELFGSDHPDIAEALNGLARVYCDQGRSAEAQALLTRALAIRERTLGPDHPHTRSTRSALAAILSPDSNSA